MPLLQEHASNTNKRNPILPCLWGTGQVTSWAWHLLFHHQRNIRRRSSRNPGGQDILIIHVVGYQEESERFHKDCTTNMTAATLVFLMSRSGEESNKNLQIGEQNYKDMVWALHCERRHSEESEFIVSSVKRGR